MQDTKIIIKAKRKPSPSIKIRRRFLSVNDIKSLTQNVLRLNDFAPLQQSTIQDFFDKTNQYLKKVEPNKNPLIKIKRVKLYKSAN
jgi:hypothetical protein